MVGLFHLPAILLWLFPASLLWFIPALLIGNLKSANEI